MKIRQLYLQGRHLLAQAGIDSPDFDTSALISSVFGLSRTGLSLHGDREAPAEQEALFLSYMEERAARRPLQYILGEWDFMGLTLAVGEGVLVPREDTSVLVHALADCLKEQETPSGLDLCAGTGAVALGLCSFLTGAEITCLELSAQALPFLRENTARYPQFGITVLEGNLLCPQTASLFPDAALDFIASNPPYIQSGVLCSLQKEVQKEPALALDGGADGLLFYRAIAKLWLPLLKPGGRIAVEIGETQAREVTDIFIDYGVKNLITLPDLNGLDRVVLGTK